MPPGFAFAARIYDVPDKTGAQFQGKLVKCTITPMGFRLGSQDLSPWKPPLPI